MNLAEQAKNVAAAGRHGDTTLLHLNPVELQGIASILPLTVNPETGYAEAFLPLLLGAAAPALLGGTTLGATLGATGLGMAGSLAGGIAQGALTGDMESGLMQGALGAATGGIGGALSGLGSAAAGGLAGSAASGAAGSAAGGAAGAGAGGAAGATAGQMATPAATSMPASMAGGGAAGGMPQAINAAPPGVGSMPPGAGGPTQGMMPPSGGFGAGRVPTPMPRPAGLGARGPMGSPGNPINMRAPVPSPAAAAPAPGPLAGRAAPESGGIGGFLKANGGKLAAAAVPAALSLASSMGQGGGKAPKKKKRGPRTDRKRSERDYTHSEPDAQGRENSYFSRRRMVPYHEGGIVSMFRDMPRSIPNRFRNFDPSSGPAPGQVPGEPRSFYRGRRPIGQFQAFRPDAVYGNQNQGLEQQHYVPPVRPDPTPAPVTGGGGGGGSIGGSTPDRGPESEAGKGSQRAQGGIVSMMDRPQDEAMAVEQFAGGPEDELRIIAAARMAIRGEHPNPESAIRSFISRYGAKAFESLMQREQSGGRSDGQSDSVPAINPGGGPAALSEGEYVVPADVVSHLGNGSTNAGAETMNQMVQGVRQARTGRTDSPDQIDPMKALPV